MTSTLGVTYRPAPHYNGPRPLVLPRYAEVTNVPDHSVIGLTPDKTHLSQWMLSVFPTCSVVFVVPDKTSPLTAILTTKEAVARRVDGAVTESAYFDASLLRFHLADPLDRGVRIAEWVQKRCDEKLPPTTVDTIAQIVDAAPVWDSLHELCSARGIVPTSARARFKQAGLPTPSSWFQMAKVLDMLLIMHRFQDVTVHDAALEFGFSDHTGVTHAVRRTFGLSVTEARSRIGWQGFVARWWHANKRATYAPA